MTRAHRNYIHIFLLILLSIFLFTMCSENTSDSPNNFVNSQLIGATECKTFGGTELSYEHPVDHDCIDYIYDGIGTLSLTHVNAGFNCCPGELTAEITVVDNAITITEHEEEAACRCNCLYDLSYLIENLSPGIYTITVKSPYANDLVFTADLSSTIGDSYCVNRSEYPWGG